MRKVTGENPGALAAKEHDAAKARAKAAKAAAKAAEEGLPWFGVRPGDENCPGERFLLQTSRGPVTGDHACGRRFDCAVYFRYSQ